MKRTTEIHYEKFRQLDRIDVISTGLFPLITRAVTSKEPFNLTIPTHTAFSVIVHKQVLFMEMAQENPFTKAKLRLTPPSHYLNKKTRAIKAVYRNTGLLEDSQTIQLILEQAFEDFRHNLEYDYKGILAFVFSRIKENPKRAYCSEYYYLLTRSFISYPKYFQDRVSPYDLEKTSAQCGFFPVNGAVTNS